MKKYLIVKVTKYHSSGNRYFSMLSYDDFGEAIHMYELIRDLPLDSSDQSEEIYLNKVFKALDNKCFKYQTLIYVEKSF